MSCVLSFSLLYAIFTLQSVLINNEVTEHTVDMDHAIASVHQPYDRLMLMLPVSCMLTDAMIVQCNLKC